MKRAYIWGFTIVIALVIGIVLGFALYIQEALRPMPASPEAQRISYPSGTSPAELATELEAKGMVRSAKVFTWYLKYKKEGARFQAGEYEMTPGLTPDEIIGVLKRGETMKEAALRLTVPEGFTIRQIAEKLQQQYQVDASAFMQTAQSLQPKDDSAASQIPNDPALKVRLEGYLFPDTYEWKRDVSPQDMVERMSAELDKKLQELPQGWQDALQRQGLSLHQALTIASLVEREVAVEEERPVVSGVIHSRLKQGMPLQIDATVQYLLDKPKERLFEKDLLIESPYNTYLNKGLPPGPIASPSLASIQAAIYPAETKYLFYVTKKDGSKGHLFAETFEQHKKNIEESNKSAGGGARS